MSIFRVRISECRMNIRKKTKDLISFFLYHIENLYLLTYLVSLEPSQYLSILLGYQLWKVPLL